MKKKPTAEERRHWDKVAQMPCLACGAWPVEPRGAVIHAN
jgi:hypothetical protein